MEKTQSRVNTRMWALSEACCHVRAPSGRTRGFQSTAHRKTPQQVPAQYKGLLAQATKPPRETPLAATLPFSPEPLFSPLFYSRTSPQWLGRKLSPFFFRWQNQKNKNQNKPRKPQPLAKSVFLLKPVSPGARVIAQRVGHLPSIQLSWIWSLASHMIP